MTSAILPKRPRRAVNSDSRFFAEGLRDGKILLQRCDACAAIRHPPRPMCSHCQSFEWTATAANGRGSLYSYAVHHHPRMPGLPDSLVPVLIELEEGVRMVGDLIGSPDDPAFQIGAPMEAVIGSDPGDDQLLVRWRIAGGDAA